jgi:hypothetical protein
MSDSTAAASSIGCSSFLDVVGFLVLLESPIDELSCRQLSFGHPESFLPPTRSPLAIDTSRQTSRCRTLIRSARSRTLVVYLPPNQLGPGWRTKVGGL